MTSKRVVDRHKSPDPRFNHWKTRFKAAAGSFEQGKLSETRTLIFRALMEAEQLEEARDFAVPACKLGLAIVSMEQGDFAEAKRLFDSGLFALQNKPGDDKQELYAAGLRFLAMWHERQENLEEAENCLRDSINILQELGAESAVQLAYSLADLCHILIEEERHGEAETIIQSAMEIIRETLGREDPSYDWAKIIYQTCIFHNDQDLMIEALENAANALQFKVGLRHPSLVRVLKAHLSALKKRGLVDQVDLVKEKFGLLCTT